MRVGWLLVIPLYGHHVVDIITVAMVIAQLL